MTKAANCLNLVGDGDDVDVLYAVEEAFSVKISDAEALRCETVGQLFDIVSSKLNISEARHLRCPTALAFFRLRAALRRLGYVQRLTPKTDLRTIFRAHRAKSLHDILSRETDLPALELHPATITALALITACGVAFSLWFGSWLPLLGSAVLAIILGFVLPQTISQRTASLGDFASNCAAWNYGRLSKQAGGARRRDVWKAVTIVVRESTGTSFIGEMNYDTRFFAERSS
ncbi:acyl carrier protein [Bradyrhizobium sp. BR 10289]|uniref:acyl carrier protein n=1 Tax=Bradyrhizobium sp. BR 10289 TaxID=2749993 RepID=UPI001C64E2D4|nr:acyl carrier protein [Bradyrhizobium sp. BR 10289]MBW7969862.1 hypothetical protein [Bradyrhizobium sp. BR 10289]